MRASRVLRSVGRHVPPPSSVLDRFLLAPRTTLDMFASAGSACFDLITKQKERDAFVEACNDGVINPAVFGQADFGMVMMLALYNDMNSPLFKKHGFEVKEFLEGAKMALGEFHEVQTSLQLELCSDKGAAKEEEQEEGAEAGESTSPKDEKSAPSVDGESSLTSKDSKTKTGAKFDKDTLFKAIDALRGSGPPLLTAELDPDGSLRRIIERSWTKEAEADDDSLAARLRLMVTAEYFATIEKSTKVKCLWDKRQGYSVRSGSIENVALLSARAMELPADSGTSENEESMKDDSLTDARDEDVPVAAQVEVLYDVERIVETIKRDSETEEILKLQRLAGVGNSVKVGVFQGFLHKDPEGYDSIRWKLAFNRPAWEFPYTFRGWSEH